jgi:hypothetical protein
MVAFKDGKVCLDDEGRPTAKGADEIRHWDDYKKEFVIGLGEFVMYSEELTQQELIDKYRHYIEHLSDVGKTKERKYPLKEYEIWVGWYHLGQGSHPPNKPQMVDKVTAPSFKVACTLHELKSTLETIEKCIKEDRYVDNQTCRWFYNFDTNKNSWVGEYFETEDDAWKTF